MLKTPAAFSDGCACRVSGYQNVEASKLAASARNGSAQSFLSAKIGVAYVIELCNGVRDFRRWQSQQVTRVRRLGWKSARADCFRHFARGWRHGRFKCPGDRTEHILWWSWEDVSCLMKSIQSEVQVWLSCSFWNANCPATTYMQARSTCRGAIVGILAFRFILLYLKGPSARAVRWHCTGLIHYWSSLNHSELHSSTFSGR
ncbi:hypothetical protein BD310DRAFT_537376 [Dichomitus squalens]|uniref:Uncharacterized protein n=1 Tax=Dichomitus squalens TaxID=114155 RepID=A0A4Q9PTE7_9APHY|nr:hypothetical protein BD310DRAFT_537376 [Dichomitus squalens]